MPLKRPNGFSPSTDRLPVFRMFFVDAMSRRVQHLEPAVAVRVTGPLDCVDVPLSQVHHPGVFEAAMIRCARPEENLADRAPWAEEASAWAVDELSTLATLPGPSKPQPHEADLAPEEDVDPDSAWPSADPPLPAPAGAAGPDDEDEDIDLSWPSADPPAGWRGRQDKRAPPPSVESCEHLDAALATASLPTLDGMYDRLVEILETRRGGLPPPSVASPTEPPRWSWEPHGEGWTLYEGRSSTQHGLSRLFVPKDGFDARGDLLRAQILRGLSMATAKTRFDPLALQTTVQQQIHALQATLLSLVDDLQATHAECAQVQMDATAAQSTKLANALSQLERAEAIIRTQRAQIAALQDALALARSQAFPGEEE